MKGQQFHVTCFTPFQPQTGIIGGLESNVNNEVICKTYKVNVKQNVNVILSIKPGSTGLYCNKNAKLHQQT